MKPLLIGGAILAVAVSAVVAALIRPGPGSARTASGTPRPDSRAEVARRLAADDTLPPPAADAPSEEWRAYERVIEDIRRGRDPIAKGVRPQAMQAEELRRRLDERRKAAEARHQEIRDRARERAEQARREADEKFRKMGGPDRPAPSPLFSPEPLPEPVSGAKDPRDPR